jgi:hypothetical protein
MNHRQYFFQALTQFSKGNKVQDAGASNTDCFLRRDICISSAQMNKPIGNKQSLSYQ